LAFSLPVTNDNKETNYLHVVILRVHVVVLCTSWANTTHHQTEPSFHREWSSCQSLLQTVADVSTW